MRQNAAKQDLSPPVCAVDAPAPPELKAISDGTAEWVPSPARALHARLSEAFDPHAVPVPPVRGPLDTLTTVLGGVLLGSVIALWCVLDLAVKSIAGVRPGAAGE